MEWCDDLCCGMGVMQRVSVGQRWCGHRNRRPIFFFFSAAWSAPVGTGHISDVALPWGGAIPGVRAAGDGVSHAES